MKLNSLLLIPLFFLTASCKESTLQENVSLDRIYAWCIVPFDSLERSPKERVKMLKEMGITKYAYDWREKHLLSMAEELTLAKENDVEVISIWLWLDDLSDSPDKLSESNEKVFNIIKQVGYNGQVWLGINSNFFENLSEAEAVSKGAEIISVVSKRANSLGCKVALYNHGDWFGEPANQIKIIKALPEEDLGIIYNFHHAHHHIDVFPEMARTMLPYLWMVNLNGMKREGPKILSIGAGDYEKEMIEVLLKEGYEGDFGILGHIADKDVEVILKANLKGLEEIEVLTGS